MILLDTHVWLWLNIAVEEIPSEILKTLARREQKIYLSAASAWEISIKHASGKLPLPLPPEAYIPSRMEMNGILPLPSIMATPSRLPRSLLTTVTPSTGC